MMLCKTFQHMQAFHEWQIHWMFWLSHLTSLSSVFYACVHHRGLMWGAFIFKANFRGVSLPIIKKHLVVWKLWQNRRHKKKTCSKITTNWGWYTYQDIRQQSEDWPEFVGRSVGILQLKNRLQQVRILKCTNAENVLVSSSSKMKTLKHYDRKVETI